MNPFDLSATGLMVWGLVCHLVADWPLQNDWMAKHKAERRERWRPTGTTDGPDGEQWPRMIPGSRWWDRHPAAYVHAGIHGALLAIVFGWAAAPLALAHLLIDTRVPVAWWSRLIGQTQPAGWTVLASRMSREPSEDAPGQHEHRERPLYDVGTEVRFWTDQVFHIACIAIAALLIG
jgi:hypothetical protein